MENKKTIGIIGDEDTINGFMIAGVPHGPVLVPVSQNTQEEELKHIFQSLICRKDLSIIVVCDFVSQKIKDEIDSHSSKELPFVFVIPSRNESKGHNT